MEYAGILISSILVGVLEVIKLYLPNKKYIPAISLILGIGCGIILVGQDDIILGVLSGLQLGLSAVGLYSSGKNTSEVMLDE